MSQDKSKNNEEEIKETAEEVVEETVEEVEEVEHKADPMTQEDLEAEVKEDITEEIKKDKKEKLPEFRSGDTIRIHYKIIEGEKTRIQPYEGIVIAMKGKGQSKTFTVRRIGADGIGVERIFPLHSPNISKIEIKRKGKVRRAKLYYLRKKKGRAAVRVKDKIEVKRKTKVEVEK
jgi:large subunit ribosomal protein L19